MNWLKSLKGKVKRKEPLKGHTSYRIGGKARFFIEPKDAEDLRIVVRQTRRSGLTLFVLGAGSNVLALDRGVAGVVVKLNSPFFKQISFSGNRCQVGSALALGALVQAAKKRALSGIEFLCGIPGTVGGALVMNAGAWGKSISGCVQEVTVMDKIGRVKVLKRNNIDFAYRRSGLGKYIVLAAQLRLKKSDIESIEGRIKKFLAQRHKNQDNTSPNAGCVFKNPPNDSAGRLIDRCGLKGRRIGGAVISSRHANFILNDSHARAADVLALMRLAKKEVKNKFKVSLEPEIRIWD